MLTIKQVEEKTGLSNKTIWRLRKVKRFPEPITLGQRKIAWREADIEAFLQGALPADEPNAPAITSDAQTQFWLAAADLCRSMKQLADLEIEAIKKRGMP